MMTRLVASKRSRQVEIKVGGSLSALASASVPPVDLEPGLIRLRRAGVTDVFLGADVGRRVDGGEHAGRRTQAPVGCRCCQPSRAGDGADRLAVGSSVLRTGFLSDLLDVRFFRAMSPANSGAFRVENSHNPSLPETALVAIDGIQSRVRSLGDAQRGSAPGG